MTAPAHHHLYVTDQHGTRHLYQLEGVLHLDLQQPTALTTRRHTLFTEWRVICQV